MEAKRLLRSRLVAARATRSGTELAAAERTLADHGVAAWRGLPSVAAYAGVGTEPPTRLLLDGLRTGGVAVVLPVLVESELRWAPYDGWDRLVPGPFGLLQPAGPPGRLPAVDLLVVPALAVDVRGHRLGRGKGHFDRALAVVEASLVVAVVYDDEVLDELPVQPHDRSVGAVLTPSGLRRLDS
jgi:5-formyltetrahydrofolate cyclo-ligase